MLSFTGRNPLGGVRRCDRPFGNLAFYRVPPGEQSRGIHIGQADSGLDSFFVRRGVLAPQRKVYRRIFRSGPTPTFRGITNARPPIYGGVRCRRSPRSNGQAAKHMDTLIDPIDSRPLPTPDEDQDNIGVL
jgi:hypothetical protein